MNYSCTPPKALHTAKAYAKIEGMTLMPSGLDPRLEFGRPDRLDKALKVAGLTSIEMAAHLGVSRTTISNYTNGRTEPSRSVLRDWALKTGVPLEWLETGTVTGGPDNPGESLLSDSNRRPAAYKAASSRLELKVGTRWGGQDAPAELEPAAA